jgi:integrase
LRGIIIKMGYIPRNPALAVDHLSMHEAKAQKETFSPEEIAKLLAVPSDDWQGVILLGALAGMRRWGNVDLQAGAITFTPSKTARLGKKLTLPIHP